MNTDDAANRAGNGQHGERILIWDASTRTFHWLLALCFVLAWVSSEADWLFGLHVFVGTLALALLAFRLLWGLVGSRYARFSSFRFSAAQAMRYLFAELRGGAQRYLGHNPAGAWMVYLLLTLVALLALSGWAMLGAKEGRGLFAFLPRLLFKPLHGAHEFLANAMMLGVALHILGVFFTSLMQRENLPRSMLDGHKHGSAQAAARPAYWGALLLGAWLLAFVFAYFGTSSEPGTQRPPTNANIGTQSALPQNTLWNSECGSCHLPFHPALLPLRSWEKMLSEQNAHFGESLGLDANTLEQLALFARAQASEKFPAGEAPQRITTTAAWLHTHRRISEPVWHDKKIATQSNCAACHRDATNGTFAPSEIAVPVPQKKFLGVF